MMVPMMEPEDYETKNIIVFPDSTPTTLGVADQTRFFTFISHLWTNRNVMFDYHAGISFPQCGVKVLLCFSRCPCPLNIELRQIYVDEAHRRKGYCAGVIQLLRQTFAKLEEGNVKLCVFQVQNSILRDFLGRQGAQLVNGQENHFIFWV